jgi:hypothetical protein
VSTEPGEYCEGGILDALLFFTGEWASEWVSEWLSDWVIEWLSVSVADWVIIRW